MNIQINAEELRKALKDIEEAEQHEDEYWKELF